jgi:hypothetical protein
MAKGKKTGGRNFEPGDPRAGRPALPGDIKAARKLTAVELQRVLTDFLHLTPQQLMERISSGDATMLEGLIGSIMQKGIQDGSYAHLNFLFERTVGKVKDSLEVSLPTPFIVRRQDGSEVVMGAKPSKGEASSESEDKENDPDL